MKPQLRPCALVIAALLLPTIAAAQEASSPAPASSTPPAPAAMPDIVVLKDGSMLRGTIVELDKQKEVTIQLPTGKTRTIAMSEVTYAGAEADKPKTEAPRPQPAQSSPQGGTADGTVRPFITVQGKPATLQLRASVKDATYHLKTGSAVVATGTGAGIGWGYQVICTAPCTATLPAGSHRLAVSTGEGAPREVEDAVVVTGDSELRANEVSRAGTRWLGLSLLVCGSVVGGAMTLGPMYKCASSDDCGDGLSMTTTMLGAGVFAAGIGVGIPLLLTRNRFEITVTPTSSAPAARRSGEANTARSLVPDGVALTGRF